MATVSVDYGIQSRVRPRSIYIPLACMIRSAIVWIRCHLVKELVNCRCDRFRGMCLFGLNGAEANSEFIFDSSCIVQKEADNALDTADAFVVERLNVVDRGCILRFGVVDNLSVLVRSQLGFLW